VVSKPSQREARLRRDFADRYPDVEPEVWISAAALAERLLTRMLRDGVPDEQLPDRVLDPDHFEFRGGDAPATSRKHSSKKA
jgi:hypothetical protein